MSESESGAGGAMLLLDPTDFSLYRVPASTVDNWEAVWSIADMPFDAFEKAARTSYSSLIMETARFPTFRVRSKAIVFVRLRDGKGWAWASPMRVRHSGLYESVLGDERLLAKNMILLWPLPMAINAYLNFSERYRRNPNALGMRIVLDHPPPLQHDQRCPDDFELAGKVAMGDLSLAQKFFIASLTPNLPAFALRQSADDWSRRLGEADGSNFAEVFASVSDQWRMKPVHVDDVFPPALVARIEANRKRYKRNALRSRVSLDLPDELVERIVCIRISEDMDRVERMANTVVSLNAVSHQFRVCTHDVVTRMLTHVRTAIGILCHHPSVDPRRVQADLWASGLTLRLAFSLYTSRQPCFMAYVSGRRVFASHEGNGGQPSAAQRRAILWG